jgi:hypothetical protein
MVVQSLIDMFAVGIMRGSWLYWLLLRVLWLMSLGLTVSRGPVPQRGPGLLQPTKINATCLDRHKKEQQQQQPAFLAGPQCLAVVAAVRQLSAGATAGGSRVTACAHKVQYRTSLPASGSNQQVAATATSSSSIPCAISATCSQRMGAQQAATTPSHDVRTTAISITPAAGSTEVGSSAWSHLALMASTTVLLPVINGIVPFRSLWGPWGLGVAAHTLAALSALLGVCVFSGWKDSP